MMTAMRDFNSEAKADIESIKRALASVTDNTHIIPCLMEIMRVIHSAKDTHWNDLYPEMTRLFITWTLEVLNITKKTLGSRLSDDLSAILEQSISNINDRFSMLENMLVTASECQSALENELISFFEEVCLFTFSLKIFNFLPLQIWNHHLHHELSRMKAKHTALKSVFGYFRLAEIAKWLQGVQKMHLEPNPKTLRWEKSFAGYVKECLLDFSELIQDKHLLNLTLMKYNDVNCFVSFSFKIFTSPCAQMVFASPDKDIVRRANRTGEVHKLVNRMHKSTQDSLNVTILSIQKTTNAMVKDMEDARRDLKHSRTTPTVDTDEVLRVARRRVEKLAEALRKTEQEDDDEHVSATPSDTDDNNV